MSHYILFRNPIGGLDIETLGLASTSVVTQIGMFITNWIDLGVHPLKATPPVDFPKDWTPMVPIAFRADMNYLEQFFDGGTQDEGTVAWWEHQAPGYIDRVKSNPDAKSVGDVKRSLLEMFNTQRPERPEFVYINHPEFDYRILVTLFGNHELISGHRRIVNTAQIHSMLKGLRINESGEGIRWKKHDALEDAAWNVWTTAAAAASVLRLRLPESVLLSPRFKMLYSTSESP